MLMKDRCDFLKHLLKSTSCTPYQHRNDLLSFTKDSVSIPLT